MLFLFRRGVPVVGISLIVAGSSFSMAGDEGTLEVRGHVSGSNGAIGIENAIVTALDDKGHVVGQAKTDALGSYRMTVAQSAFHLNPSGGAHHSGVNVGNILSGVGKSAANVLTGSVPGGGSVFGGKNGLNLGSLSPLQGFTLASLTGANPLKVLTALSVASITQRLITAGLTPAKANALAPELKKGDLSKEQALQKLRDAGVPASEAEAALTDLAKAGIYASAEPAANAPGALQLKVEADGQRSVSGVAQAFVIEPDNSKHLVAYMDNVTLLPQERDGASEIENRTMRLITAAIKPEIVHVGETLSMHVELGAVPKGRKVVLIGMFKNKKTFSFDSADGEMFDIALKLDKSVPRGEQFISVLGYLSVDGKRDPKIEERMLKDGLWSLEKPYIFNPLSGCTKNRGELKVTILEENPPK